MNRQKSTVRASIRWRLPLSYMVVALVAALSLGAVLLLVLRAHYLQQENDFLESQIEIISSVAGALTEVGTPPDVLESQLQRLAVLSQTRIRLLDRDGIVVGDSGDPRKALSLASPAPGSQLGAVTPAGEPADDAAGLSEATYRSAVTIADAAGSGAGDGALERTSELVLVDETGTTRAEVRVRGPGLAGDSTGSTGEPAVNLGVLFDPTLLEGAERSEQTLRRPLPIALSGLQGYVELSEGPAIGREILRSVARGWSIAAAVAVSLAATVGWFASRRLIAPLIDLTDSTKRMAAGDLSARAAAAGADEFGVLARSFNGMAERIESTVVTLRRFVADAAHQIHTPLTALRTDLELMARGTDRESLSSRLARAQAQTARLEALATGLLDLSRIEADGNLASNATADFGALVDEVGEIFASRADQAGMEFAIESSPDVLLVRGNADQLRQAVSNLLDNAIKFTGSGGKVWLTLHRDANWVVLCVVDTGIGIPEGDLPHLFGRFHRGSNATTHPGSGLGLAIARAVVESHGGEVWAENVPDGARVCFRLPAVDRPVD